MKAKHGGTTPQLQFDPDPAVKAVGIRLTGIYGRKTDAIGLSTLLFTALFFLGR